MIDRDNYKYYTCKYDAAFKEVFIQEDTSLLKAFLESILHFKINSIEIKNSELNNDNVHIRRKLVDSIIYTDEGVFNIEVNTSLDDSVITRNTCYIMNAYSRYFMRGENYNDECKFIQINLNYNSLGDTLYDEFNMRDSNGKLLVNNFTIYYFNMDNYMKFWYNKNKKEIEKNKYLIMLNLNKEDLVTLSHEDRVVTNYMERLNSVNEDPRFQSYMSAEEDDRKLLNTYKDKAEKAFDRGMERGIEQGIEKGIEKGIEQGIEKGIEEKTIDACIRMHDNGLDNDTISKCLNISKEKVEKIIKNNN